MPNTKPARPSSHSRKTTNAPPPVSATSGKLSKPKIVPTGKLTKKPKAPPQARTSAVPPTEMETADLGVAAPMFEALIPSLPELAADGKIQPQHRRYMVQMLACYRSPSEIAKLLKEHFDVGITRQSVEYYDPTKAAGADLAPDLCRLFAETRRRFHERSADIGIGQQTFRLAEMHDNYFKLKERGALIAAQTILEQAAREVGGMFTNARVLTGAGRAPVVGDTLSREEHIEAIKALIFKGHERATASANAANAKGGD
jgi:hypothetical protein